MHAGTDSEILCVSVPLRLAIADLAGARVTGPTAIFNLGGWLHLGGNMLAGLALAYLFGEGWGSQARATA